MQYNFTIEHQRWNTGFRVSYIGTNTRQGEYGYNINQPLAGHPARTSTSRACSRATRRITYLTNGAGHQYNSLTVEVERRFANGSVLPGLLRAGARHRRPGARRHRRRTPTTASASARSGDDIPTHRFTGNLIYELPFGKGRTLLASAGRLVTRNRRRLGAERHLHRSLRPVPDAAVDRPRPHRDRLHLQPHAGRSVTIRPDILRDANLPSGPALGEPLVRRVRLRGSAAGAFGTSSRGVIKGRGHDLAAHRSGKAVQPARRSEAAHGVDRYQCPEPPELVEPCHQHQLRRVGRHHLSRGRVSDSDQPGFAN